MVTIYLLCFLFLHSQGIYKIWGTTSKGGSLNKGVLFYTDGNGNHLKPVYDFSDSTQGAEPRSVLTEWNGKLYGSTLSGGKNNKGVIFEWNPEKNTYTRKADFNGLNGANPHAGLSLYNNIFYGTTLAGGLYNKGVIFEWNPLTNTLTKMMDLSDTTGYSYELGGRMTLKDGKFYSAANQGGSLHGGVIFEWDPVTNSYLKKIDFNYQYQPPIFAQTRPQGTPLLLNNGKFYSVATDIVRGHTNSICTWDPLTNLYTDNNFIGYYVFSIGSLKFHDDHLYGVSTSAGDFSGGTIYAWDPVTREYENKAGFDNANSTEYSPAGSLTMSGSKFYGMMKAGGTNNLGAFFEWDPVTNVYTKKDDFNGVNGASPQNNDLTLAAAPVTKGLPGSCITVPSIAIDQNNNNQWVPIVDEQGNAVAEIKANGNNLGVVSTSIFINNATVRQDESQKLYLDRNISITCQTQPTSPVDIRLYIKATEYSALKNADNSNGQSSGINSINDLGIYQSDKGCQSQISVLKNAVETNAAIWGADYVFSASIHSFSSFYIAGKCLSGTPHISNVCVTPAILWPPNHQMKNVTVNYNAWSDCGAINSSLSVTSNEPADCTENGDASPDWIILDNHHLQLRAERSGRGNGRIYTITITSTDASGNTSTEKTKVVVLHDKNGNGGDDGLHHHFDCKILPNPSNHYFTIQVTSTNAKKVEAFLLDLNGRLMLKLNTVKNNTFRFGEDLRPGVYMVQITQGDQRKTIKVIKQ
ncbi:MAG: hypothetical protein JWR61_1579 [Ferruginibacter sp.]|nr:hypothetical protein [Ferruginibacter sp.]